MAGELVVVVELTVVLMWEQTLMVMGEGPTEEMEDTDLGCYLS